MNHSIMLSNVMRPYPGRSKANLPIDQVVFNYGQNKIYYTLLCIKLSLCIEKTFGIMASKWLKIRRPIIATEETINAIVQATVVLHNYRRLMNNLIITILFIIFNTTPNIKTYFRCSNVFNIRNQSHNIDKIGVLAPIRDTGSNYYGLTGKVIREKITNYLMNEGELQFQYDKILNILFI
ncbi:putative nuclease HARBI1 [Aphis craccivora]|uniref:Putative nuclease HARBI1 n=1 Tax=Aphis craccivora TaxID=307492 RepID=A0A6G0W8D9_APHCR|nr:putative nuclease HARBI1 [Aphis craccivora]